MQVFELLKDTHASVSQTTISYCCVLPRMSLKFLVLLFIALLALAHAHEHSSYETESESEFSVDELDEDIELNGIFGKASKSASSAASTVSNTASSAANTVSNTASTAATTVSNAVTTATGSATTAVASIKTSANAAYTYTTDVAVSAQSAMASWTTAAASFSDAQTSALKTQLTNAASAASETAAFTAAGISSTTQAAWSAAKCEVCKQIVQVGIYQVESWGQQAACSLLTPTIVAACQAAGGGPLNPLSNACSIAGGYSCSMMASNIVKTVSLYKPYSTLKAEAVVYACGSSMIGWC